MGRDEEHRLKNNSSRKRIKSGDYFKDTDKLEFFCIHDSSHDIVNAMEASCYGSQSPTLYAQEPWGFVRRYCEGRLKNGDQCPFDESLLSSSFSGYEQKLKQYRKDKGLDLEFRGHLICRKCYIASPANNRTANPVWVRKVVSA